MCLVADVCDRLCIAHDDWRHGLIYFPDGLGKYAKSLARVFRYKSAEIEQMWACCFRALIFFHEVYMSEHRNELERIRYMRKKKAGLCPNCGKNKPQKGYAFCEACMNLERERYTQKKEAGLCPICGKNKPQKGYALCDICRMNKNDWTALRYIRRVDHGICPVCGKPLSESEHRICTACKQHHRDLDRARYYRLKDAGICVKCGKRKAHENRSMCEICLIKRTKIAC